MADGTDRPRLNSIAVATRYTQAVRSFGGLDLADHRLSVSSSRCIDDENYYWDGRYLRKRQGYEQVGEIPEIQYVVIPFSRELTSLSEVDTLSEFPDAERKINGVNVNGIWTFADTAGTRHTIAHVGHLLFEITESDGRMTAEPLGARSSTEDSTYACWEFVDDRSQAFASNGCLWFLGGTKYVVVMLENGVLIVRAVADSDLAYVPTTTISIGYANAKVAESSSYDAVNLLTKWRKNTLLSGVGKDESDTVSTSWYDYTLDAPLIPSEMVDGEFTSQSDRDRAMAEFRITILERGTI